MARSGKAQAKKPAVEKPKPTKVRAPKQAKMGHRPKGQ